MRVIPILLVGALINVGVTVVLAAGVNIIAAPDATLGDMGRHNEIGLNVNITRRFGSELIRISEDPQPRGFTTMSDPAEGLPDWLEVSIYPSVEALPEGFQGRQRQFQARGWPWLCAWCRGGGLLVTEAPEGRVHYEAAGAYELPLPHWESYTGGQWTEPRLLPLRPIWKGFILNSLLYAALIAVLSFGWGRWRLLRRYRRGRCPRCRKDLRHDYRLSCPHCGYLHREAKEIHPGEGQRETRPPEGQARPRRRARDLLVLAISLALGGFVLTAMSTLVIAATVNPHREGLAAPARVYDGVIIHVWRIDGFGTSFVRIEEDRDLEHSYNSPLDPLARVPSGLNPEFLAPGEAPSLEYRSRTFELRGWPWRCVWCETQHVIRPSYEAVPLDGARLELPLLSGWQGPRGGRPTPRLLPLQPVWSGLALNTLFYALSLGIVVLIIRRGLNLRRYRRGRCPRCGYDRRFAYASPCPECGA